MKDNLLEAFNNGYKAAQADFEIKFEQEKLKEKWTAFASAALSNLEIELTTNDEGVFEFYSVIAAKYADAMLNQFKKRFEK